MIHTKELTEKPEVVGKIDPFKKSGKLIRSPIKKRTGSFSEIERRISYGKEKEQEETQEEKKRKRSQEEEIEEKKYKKGERTTINTLKGKVHELAKEVDGEVLKTGKMDVLVREIQELVEQLEVEENIRIEEEKSDGELKRRRIIKGLISRTDTYVQFKEVENKKWPRECFERVKIKTGTFPLDKGDIILLREESDVNMEFGAARRLKESFPELVKMNGNGWETLVLSSRRITETVSNESWEKQIHVGKKTEDEELFNQFMTLKSHLEKHKREKGVLPVDKGFSNPIKIAKMLECVFRNTETKIDLYCWEGDLKDENEKRGFRNNAIMVKTTAENYANTLRKLKEDICQSGKRIEFKKIRSARNGNMIIELNEGDTGVEVKELLTKSGRNMEVKVLDKERNSGKKFILRELDAIITGEEITETLRATAIDETEKEEVKLISIRSAPGETQAAIVQMKGKHAERINSEGGVTMGLLKIKLKDWVVVDRCFKCWEHGHLAAQCTGPDRTNACLKCGKKDGHNAKTCTNKVYCPICQREGHRAGSGACPKMKTLLAKLRKQEGERRRALRR